MASLPPASQSRKRPLPTSNSGINRKRVRLQDARRIASESTSATLQSGALDVPSFIASREFEIQALTNAMASSKAANTKRAFQSVPRGMRRRTASHNPARVPQRLRRRAIHEMTEDNTPVHTMKKHKKKTRDWVRRQTAEKLRVAAKKKEVIEKIVEEAKGREDVLRKPPRPHSRYRKRQKEKTWLPTHIWHAKRAHMSVRWRFAVPESCNEKSFRATARAAGGVKGGMTWDMSYFAEILLRGQMESVRKVVNTVAGDAAIPKKAKEGLRSWETWAYLTYPASPIAPVTFVFSPPEESGEQRCLLRIHPSAFLELWNKVIAVAKTAPTKVTVEDLRYELGSIQVCGPTATDALLSTLSPADPSSPSATLFFQLAGLTNPASLPPGAFLSFSITDPRLRFPPRSTPQPNPDLFATTSTFTPPPSAISLFSRPSRSTSVKLQPSNKRIHARKAAALPGTFPAPAAHDPSIPILLLASTNTWTLLCPWKWVQSIWHSLQHAPQHLRFGGLRELRQFHFSNQAPLFPIDYPGTAAGRAWEAEAARERLTEWEKRPKAKRTNYDKTGEIGDWWKCDWGLLLAKPALEPQLTLESVVSSEEEPQTQTFWQLVETEEEGIPAGALVTVRVSLMGKGAPRECARLWNVPAGTADTKKPPPKEMVGELVGFLTTGNYSLVSGQSVGLGAVSWSRVQGKRRGICVVKDVGIGVGRWAHWGVEE